MQNQWIERVSEYVDGELSPADRMLFEARMDEDPDLRRAVDQVQALVGQAAALGPVEPSRDLWPAIAARIGEQGPARERPAGSPAPRPRAWRRASAVAAGIALMVLSASAGWWLHDLGRPAGPDLAAIAQPQSPQPRGDVSSARFAEQEERLAESIEGLETVLLRYGDRLDPDTREAIVANLELIDQAIDDAHRALKEDPNSDYLHAHITNSLERKVRLLEDAARLAGKEI